MDGSYKHWPFSRRCRKCSGKAAYCGQCLSVLIVTERIVSARRIIFSAADRQRISAADQIVYGG